MVAGEFSQTGFLESAISQREQQKWNSWTMNRLLVWLISFKLVYVSGVVFVLNTCSAFDEHQFWSAMERWPTAGEPTFLSHFGTWDVAHYLHLSRYGYQDNSPSCAFYPLWPLLIHLSATIGMNEVIGGMLLSNILSILGWGLFYRLISRRCGADIGVLSLSLLIVYPGSIFFQFAYSESLFFYLLMQICCGIEARRWWTAGVAAFFLPLSRPTGILSLIPLVWLVISRAQSHGLVESHSSGHGLGHTAEPIIRDECQKRLNWSITSVREMCLQRWCIPALIPGAVFGGWICYLTGMWWTTGNPFEGFEAQRFWRENSIRNILDIPGFLQTLFKPTAFHDFAGSLLDRIMFIVVLHSLPRIWRAEKSWFLWTFSLCVIPALSGRLVSFTRYSSVAFPIFIVWANRLVSEKTCWLRLLVLCSFVLLHLALLWRFVNFRWAG